MTKNIKAPSIDEVERYLDKWASIENYTLQENALDKLFFDICPNNTDISDVLLKCSTLNDFYSTNIFSIFFVAKHIQALDIDKRLKAGDLSLVNDIATVKIGNKTRNFYSFASKYCNHHNPNVFAIYDSYVEKCLKYFKKIDKFSDFEGTRLKDYTTFNRVLNEFKKFYQLDQYSLKEIDKYLWQLGKKHFPRKY